MITTILNHEKRNYLNELKKYKEVTMKTPIDRLVEHIRSEYPDLDISPHLIFNFKQLEKMEQQLAYNAGFANAKKIYNENG
jgi:hypothetical protein